MERTERTERLLGDKVNALKDKRVAVFGAGGVGGYAIECLVRTGVGSIDVVDNDTVALSNINRQIIALVSTVGQKKVDVIKARMKDINPDVTVNSYDVFVLNDNVDLFPWDNYDYVVDAVDTVTAKLAIITEAKRHGVPVISAMGAGNKLDPTKFVITDVFSTSVCPLARVMRKELRARNIDSLKVVYSTEEAVKITDGGDKRTPGSISYCPATAGLFIAYAVIDDLLSTENGADGKL